MRERSLPLLSLARDRDAAAQEVRMQNLIDALRSSGQADATLVRRPSAVRPRWDAAVLRAVDETLSANGLSQPLVVRETAYDDAAVASAIKEFETNSARRVLEVMGWPGRAGQPCPPSPAFQANAYIQTLRGAPPPNRLTATGPARRGVVLRTTCGEPVTALEADRYTLSSTTARGTTTSISPVPAQTSTPPQTSSGLSTFGRARTATARIDRTPGYAATLWCFWPDEGLGGPRVDSHLPL